MSYMFEGTFDAAIFFDPIVDNAKSALMKLPVVNPGKMWINAGEAWVNPDDSGAKAVFFGVEIFQKINILGEIVQFPHATLQSVFLPRPAVAPQGLHKVARISMGRRPSV